MHAVLSVIKNRSPHAGYWVITMYMVSNSNFLCTTNPFTFIDLKSRKASSKTL